MPTRPAFSKTAFSKKAKKLKAKKLLCKTALKRCSHKVSYLPVEWKVFAPLWFLKLLQDHIECARELISDPRCTGEDRETYLVAKERLQRLETFLRRTPLCEIEDLDLRGLGLDQVWSKAVDMLKSCSRLKTLNLSENDLDREDLSQLKLPLLEQLWFYDNERRFFPGLPALKVFETSVLFDLRK